MSSPKRKVTLYFNSGMLAETQKEAIRQDRSVSWIIQAAWKIARDEVRRLPGVSTAVPGAPSASPLTPPAVEPVHAPGSDGVPRPNGRPARE
jgi:uncharacterized small protein (TIGR04563 family)